MAKYTVLNKVSRTSSCTKLDTKEVKTGERSRVLWTEPSAPATKVSSKSLKLPMKRSHSPPVAPSQADAVANNYKCDLAKYSWHLNGYKSSKIDTAHSHYHQDVNSSRLLMSMNNGIQSSRHWEPIVQRWGPLRLTEAFSCTHTHAWCRRRVPLFMGEFCSHMSSSTRAKTIQTVVEVDEASMFHLSMNVIIKIHIKTWWHIIIKTIIWSIFVTVLISSEHLHSMLWVCCGYEWDLIISSWFWWIIL